MENKIPLPTDNIYKFYALFGLFFGKNTAGATAGNRVIQQAAVSKSLAFLAAISFGIGYGFSKWHRDVQSLADETARVQLEIAKLQLDKQRRGVEGERQARVKRV